MSFWTTRDSPEAKDSHVLALGLWHSNGFVRQLLAREGGAKRAFPRWIDEHVGAGPVVDGCRWTDMAMLWLRAVSPLNPERRVFVLGGSSMYGTCAACLALGNTAFLRRISGEDAGGATSGASFCVIEAQGVLGDPRPQKSDVVRSSQ